MSNQAVRSETSADSFQNFRAAYITTYRRMLKYTLNQVGSQYACEEMAAMADAHPEWVEIIEAEGV
jgi:hypothetical protein